MAKSQDKEIATTQPSAIAQVAPKSLVTVDTSAASHIQIPRLSVLQGSSDAVTRDGHRQGTFFNNVMNVNYGDNVEVIPFGPTRAGALYIPKGTKKMKCKSADGKYSFRGDLCAQCPFGVYHKTWGADGAPPECSSTLDFTVLIVADMTPALLTFKRTSLKTGEKLMTQLLFSKKPLAITIGSKSEEKPAGIYQAIRTVKQRVVTDEELKEVEHYANILAQSKIEVVDDGVESDDDFL